MSAYSIKCSGCGEIFDDSVDFDGHICPAIPQPMDEEPWEDYRRRCEASKLAYKAKMGGCNE